MFTEDSDPIRDMGIGTMESTLADWKLRITPMEDLEELYKRVHNAEKANVIIDGVKFDDLPHGDKINFNNAIVRAMNVIRKREKVNAARSIGYKPNELIKFNHHGEDIYGFAVFSKRGLLQADAHGRISFVTINNKKWAVRTTSIMRTSKKEKLEYSHLNPNIMKTKTEKTEKQTGMSKDEKINASKTLSLAYVELCMSLFEETHKFFEEKYPNISEEDKLDILRDYNKKNKYLRNLLKDRYNIYSE